MTPGEVIRYCNTRAKMRRLEAQERASHDYILANLIVRGVGMVLGSKASFPSVEEAYPGLFDEVIEKRTEEIEERKQQLYISRFKQFAQTYNNRFNNKEVLNA